MVFLFYPSQFFWMPLFPPSSPSHFLLLWQPRRPRQPQQPPAAPSRSPGSSRLCSYIRLLSEARRASSLLCMLGTNFCSSQGMALLLGTDDLA